MADHQRPLAAGLSILTINTGSSSLKAALYQVDGQECEIGRRAVVERIGLNGGAGVRVLDGSGEVLASAELDLADHAAALQHVFQALEASSVDAAGHRVVHGGSRYSRPQLITPDVVGGLRELVPIDPTHLPQAIAAIEEIAGLRPALPQVACFDTAFHRSMPAVAQRYPLPRELAAAGIIRYGFHGLSYEYIVGQLRQIDPANAGGRAILAHLGNGASMAAVTAGRPIDTTMGFSPTGGLMMGTRSGDLDPGVLVYLAHTSCRDPDELSDLVNRRSGLLGVSTRSSDMRDLLTVERSDPPAAEAVELFCYQARKHLGALAAVLGGLDTVVFTGGIGEHAPSIRDRICHGLESLGISLDPDRNAAGQALISRPGSAVNVRVMPTDEDVVIARQTYDLLQHRSQ